MKILILLILTILPVSHQLWPFKHNKKKWWPTTPFPIITLPLSDFYLNTIFPAFTQNFTFPTIYTTATGSGGASLPTFPTLPTIATTKAPTAPGLPTFPTLPGGVTVNPVLPSFPPSSGANVGPGLPAFPSQIQQPGGPIVSPPGPIISSNLPIQCSSGVTVCPFPGTSVVVNLQPQLNPYTNCPCIDPRAYYGGAQQQGIPIQQGFPGPNQQGFPGQIPQGFPGQIPQGYPGQIPQGYPGQIPQGFPQPIQQGFPGQGQDCSTAKRLPGFCVSLRTCELLIRLLVNDNIYEFAEQSDYVNQSPCGYSENTLVVCCPYYLHTPTTMRPSPSSYLFTFQTLLPFFQNIVPTTPSTTATTNTAVSPLLNTCGISNFSQTRVVGGTPAKQGQFPWMAALGYLNYLSQNLDFYCAGSLITTTHVLTTAHCINDNLYLVRLGQHDIRSKDKDEYVFDSLIEAKILHNNFNPTLILNDIAMLKLKTAVPISERIRTICLPLYEPLRSQENFIGHHPFIAGWGTTGYQHPLSSVLRTTQVRVTSLQNCSAKYRIHFPNQIFDSRVICAGNGNKDACQGDSGGPMMLPQIISSDVPYFYFVLIGLVSYGYECANSEFPGVYTRVGEYMPWILQHLTD